MKIVTAEEMREIDRLTTEQYGVPSLTLMENAGAAVAEFAQKHFEFSSVCVVCGKGNNGGDGFVAARKLHQVGKKVCVLILAKSAKELRGDAAKMFKKLPVKPLWISKDTDLAKADVKKAFQTELIVDAIVGTGFSPPLRGVARKAVGLINKSSARVLSIDLPSGVDADTNEGPNGEDLFVHADAMVSFTAPKPALVFGRLTYGPIAVAQIGSPASVVAACSKLHQDVITSADVQTFAVSRALDAHKGQFGHVLVIGGSVGKAGAAAMAGLAALRAGAGLVTVACPKSVQPTIAALAPELMTVRLEETAEGTIAVLALARREELLKGKSVVAIGPGLSRNPETEEFIRDLVSICSVSLVIDADAINAFEGRIEEVQADDDADDNAIRVLTPHPGEMGRLLNLKAWEIQASRVKMALQAATQAEACVVLKGHLTVVASPSGHVWINPTGNPGMAKGGSGDVLTGVIAGLLAQTPQLKESYSWKADADPDMDIGNPYLQGIYRWVSKRDPKKRELEALAEKYNKTHDPRLHMEIQAKIQTTLNDAITLVGTLHVARAVYLHGLAGDIAASLYGQNSMIATDIIDCLGEAFAICESEACSKFAYLQR